MPNILLNRGKRLESPRNRIEGKLVWGSGEKYKEEEDEEAMKKKRKNGGSSTWGSGR